MKNIFIIFAAGILLACNANEAQEARSSGNSVESGIDSATHARALNDSTSFTSIQWLDSIQQSMGQVKEGQVVEVSWRFKNTGDKPLIITKVEPGCGCTTAEKNDQPIAPGKEGVIRVKFNSEGRQGFQNKEVYVEANTRNGRNHLLGFHLDIAAK